MPPVFFILSAPVFFTTAFASHTDHTSSQPACRTVTPGMARMQNADIVLLDDRQRRVQLRAFIADDATERAAGYQHICPRVIDRTAILFRYAKPNASRFHMQNVRAPLDIGFFDADGVLIQSMLMRPNAPGENILYGPMQPFQYALETRAGFFREKNLSAGRARLLPEALP